MILFWQGCGRNCSFPLGGIKRPPPNPPMADRVRINEWKAFTFLNQFDLKEIKSFFRSFEIITTRKAQIRMPFFHCKGYR